MSSLPGRGAAFPSGVGDALPAGSATAPAARAAAAAPAVAEAIRAGILLVDDRPDKLLAMQVLLGPFATETTAARSGEEALRLLLRQDYAVILLDVNMPGMDGFETAALIRQRRASERTPIIFVTAISDTETHVSRGYSLGAVDYIFTPVVAEVLRAKIAVFTELYRKTRQVEHLRAAAELRAEGLERRLAGLLNRLDVGVFRSDLDGQVREANPAFRRLLGLAEAAPLPRMQELFADPDEERELHRRLLVGGGVQDAEVRLRRANGSLFWAALTGTASEGSADGLLADITDRKEAERLLACKAAELERSNASLEQFACIASHDLQEPLRMISSYSSLIATHYHERLDERARKYLGYAIEGATRMRSLVSGLLAFSRVGREQNEHAAIDTAALVAEVVAEQRATLDDAGGAVTVGSLPPVEGDRILVGQLLRNLLGNAIKFRGTVPLRVAIAGERDGDQVRMHVADNGIGIAPEFHERIFGIFQRLHPRDEFPGTGIGLALCRRVVEHHGGRIRVESAPGSGARFVFTLPAVGTLR